MQPSTLNKSQEEDRPDQSMSGCSGAFSPITRQERSKHANLGPSRKHVYGTITSVASIDHEKIEARAGSF